MSDGFSPQINIARMDGQRGVLLAVYKTGATSDAERCVGGLQEAADHQESLPAANPDHAALRSIDFREGGHSGSGPRRSRCRLPDRADDSSVPRKLAQHADHRHLHSACPFSISITILSMLHETINLMTLGGLALAVGILVDDATVAIENINRNLAQGKQIIQAILDGAQQIAVPALVSTLSICIVFVPMFFLTGVAKFLFVPLAEAVVFAMLASYILSRTLVPTLAMYLLKEHHGEEHATGNDIFSRAQRGFAHGFDRMRDGYRASLAFCLERAWLFVVLFLVFCLASLSLVPVLGRDFFPTVDAGLIRLHMRARAGQRVEETAREADGVDNLIRRVIPPEDLGNILDNIGLFNSTVNTAYSNSGVIGESDAEILIGLKPERKQSNPALRGRSASATGQGVPRHAILFSTRRHDQPDSEFRRARADRYSADRPEPEGQLSDRGANHQPHPAHSRRGGRARATAAFLSRDISQRRPHSRAIRGLESHRTLPTASCLRSVPAPRSVRRSG